LQATVNRARQLRSHLTDAEQMLWRYLRFRQIDGYKFRRQRPIGPYIVDFVCLEKKLIVELDGGQHADQKRYDVGRDRWLAAQGYEVLRFWNHDVLTNTDSVKEAIYRALNGPPPVSSP
jgi:very-short-patch-repair endonuclease